MDNTEILIPLNTFNILKKIKMANPEEFTEFINQAEFPEVLNCEKYKEDHRGMKPEVIRRLMGQMKGMWFKYDKLIKQHTKALEDFHEYRRMALEEFSLLNEVLEEKGEEY